MNSKRLILALLTICSATVSATHCVQAADAPAIYQVGVAKADVTPDYPIRLNGFGFRREESEGITQPIWIKAIAIGSDEERPVILFTIDSTGIRQSMIDKVAKRLRAKAGIDRERIVATFTHSHTTPKLNDVCDTVFSSPIPPEHQAHIDRYDAEVTDAFEKAALDALADRKPLRLEWVVGTVGFAVNRRMEKGPVDHALPVLVVRSADDNAIRAIYTSYACHCVTLSNNKISGDWAGFAQHAIEMNHPGAIAMVSIGCGSDSNPSSGVTGDNTAAAADQGAQIADEVERLLSGSLRPISGTIAATLTKIDLPLNPPPDRAALEQAAATDDPAGYNAKFQLAKLDRGEPLQTKLDYPIQIVAFGDSLAMVFLAGEVCVDYSLRLKSELDSERVWLHGYANDFCAYIPSERLLKEGGYGGGAEVVYFALPNTLATGLEEKIIGQVHKQIPHQFEGKGPRKQASAQPWPLDEALASIVPKKGFVVEVAAAEPLVADPVAIDFGPDGRMWVAEMPDYSRFADEDFKPNGSCRVLTDVDGDGRFDHGTTFAEGLRFPTDVKAWGDGVIVCDAPDVLYFEDADGDGKAETRKVLLTGFETHNAQARVNSLRWGLDNWLYGSCGIFGGKIRTHTGRVVELGGRDFRFRPSTGELEPVTGATQQGRTRDDWGNWFGCDSGSLINHYPLDDSYLSRNPHIAPPATRVSVPTGNDPSALHPIGEPSLFELSGPPGRPTAACGLEIYRDELMGNEFANNSFVAEPVNQLVHRRILVPRGATFGGVRAGDEADVEFLASTDPWFRPVQIRTGPDGCLYIVDMHRAVIEHPKFIPEESLQQIDVTAGREEGRIYRVRRSDVTPRKPVRLDHLNAEGLAAAIDSPNGPQRDMAQQLIVQRAAVKAIPVLKELVRRSDRPTARLQALCTLDGLKALDAEIISAALADAHPSVRRHSIRFSEPMLAAAPHVADRILKLVDNDDPQVALQLAYTLGELNDPRQAEALARLATKHPEEPYILAGVWSSVNQSNVGPVVGAILASAEKQPLPPTLMRPAIRLIAELGNDDDLLTASKSIRVDDETEGADWRFVAAAELLEQSRRRSASVSGLLAQFAPMIDKARETLTAGEDDEAQQLAALRILAAGGAKSEELLEFLTPLLEPRNSPAVQQAAIELVAAIGGKKAANVLLAPWPGYTSAARAQAFDVLFGSAEHTSVLLDRIAAGEISAADIDALQRQRLTTHPNKTLRDRAANALTNALDTDRDVIVKQYVSAVNEMRAGDAGRGRQLFAKHCSSCHRLEDQGHEVGPDLAALTSRAPAALIESILDPNRAVDERYRSYSALTIDGLAHAGILSSETSTSITLTEQQGKKQTLLRSELDAFANTGKSLMPEGLERDLTPPDVADVVAYLAAAGLPAKKIDGNEPRQITPDYDGSLWLLAENAHIFGHEITYEKPHRNIGFWHDQKDFVAWDVEVTTPGEYEVYLHWACINEAAGSAFIIEGGENLIISETADTGGYDRFQSRRVGRVQLDADSKRITVRPHGPLKTVNLMDLRGVYLTPVGVAADRAIAGEPPRKGGDAATAIAKLVDGLAVGRPEEYQRIQKIWEEAIAAGRRNEKGELLRVIDLSLPKLDERLADWQAVVIGGGVVNGVSQAGDWPERRLSELLKEYPHLRARWDRTLKLAASMAMDQQNTKIGTRYDAFRILGAGKWEDFGEKLGNCLKSERNAELQMGVISAMGDMEAEQSTKALIASLEELADENRQLAIEALLRTPERSKVLLNAVNKGEVSRDLLTEEQMEKSQRSADD